MSLYDDIKNCENEIAKTKNAIALLENTGFEVNGQTPSLREETERLLSSKYKDNQDNLVIQRIKVEDLQGIVDDIKSQRRYALKLPFNGKRRREYNKQVDQLAEVAPYADALKTYSIFSILEPEGAIGFSSTILALGLGLFAYFNPELRQHTPDIVLTGSLTGLFFGSMFGASGSRGRKYRLSRLQENVGYIDTVLGRRTSEMSRLHDAYHLVKR